MSLLVIIIISEERAVAGITVRAKRNTATIRSIRLCFFIAYAVTQA